MTNTDGVAVPLPENDKVWEIWTQDLLSEKHQTMAVAYGRSGQKQHGIDFTVDTIQDRIGVQCKFVKSGSRLDVNQVKADYNEACLITPALTEFHLYTSAESDTHTIDLLATFAHEVTDSGPTFRYFMRREFESEVRRYGLLPRLLGLESSISVSSGTTSNNPVGNTRLVSQSETTIHGPASMAYGQMLVEVQTLVQQGKIAVADGLISVLLNRKSELSDTELARVYATQAVLASRNGSSNRAAALWRKSADIEPKAALQHARRAQSFLSEGNDSEAYAEAQAAMAYPNPPTLAAVVLIVSGGSLGKRQEVEALLTPRIKQERDVAIVLAYDALEDGRFEDADQIRRGLELEFPDDADILLINANCRFQRALGGLAKRRPEAILEQRRQDILEAQALYQQALQRYDPKLERSVWLPAALNLLSVLKILGSFREAADVALLVIDHYGIDIEDFPALALALAEGGRASDALKHIENIDSPAATLRIVQASALLHLNQFAKALTLLEEIIDQLSGLDADNARWMLLYSRWKAEAAPDIDRLTEEFYEKADDKLSACQRIVANASHLGFPALTEQYARRAIDLYEHEPDPDRHLFIANAKLTIGDTEGAMSTLAPVVNLNHPQSGPVEELYAFCLLRLHRFESLDRLLERIPADSAESARFDGYRVDSALQRGDYPQALIAVRKALQGNSSDLKLRTLEAYLLREKGQIEEAKNRISTIEYLPQISLESISLYLREARLLDEGLRAKEFVYRWIRENGENPENQAWFLAQFLMATEIPETEMHDSVTAQCGVCLQGIQDVTDERWLVIDSRFPEAVSMGWFTPLSQEVAPLLGKRCGDTVKLPAFPGGLFIIKAILPVYSGAFKLLMSKYGKQTPMSESLRRMSIASIDGKPDLSNVFEQLDASRDATKQLLATYAEQPISLGYLAKLMHRNPLDIWCGMYGSTEHNIRSESAGNSLISHLHATFDAGNPAIILDPITLASWAHWGLLPLVKHLFHTISMSTSAVDVINQKMTEITLVGEAPHMQLAAGEQPGQYTRIEITPEMAQAEKNWLQETLQFIQEHVTVCPTPVTGLPEDIYSSMRHNLPAYIADQMQLTAHQQGILVADDLQIECFCALLKLTQASTRRLFLVTKQRAHIDTAQYIRIFAKLAEANYEFITFSHQDLIAASELHGTTLKSELVVLLRYLSIPSLDLRSAIQVLVNYWSVVTNERMSPHLVESTVTIALSALTRHATRSTSAIIDVLDKIARTAIGGEYGEVIHTATSKWCRGHFLTPPPSL